MGAQRIVNLVLGRTKRGMNSWVLQDLRILLVALFDFRSVTDPPPIQWRQSEEAQTLLIKYGIELHM